MLIRILGAWFLLMVLAILNGSVRNALLTPKIGEQSGHVASTLILSGLIFGVTWYVTPWIGPRSPREAWLIGLSWLMLTVAFEFLAGHSLFGHPWQKLYADYNVFRGRIWLLVLVMSLVAPTLVFRLRGLP